MTIGDSSAHAFYHADGSGNITTMVNDKQLIVARYIYDPFGNILAASGTLADVNSYRFSSQEYHQPSGLSLYLYRAYDPNLQRFINRDPIEEAGGINLYAFVRNNPLSRVDLWGLADDGKDDLDRKLDRVLACGVNGAQFTKAETGIAVEFRDELEKEFAKQAACSAAGWGVGKALGAIGRKAGCMWKACKGFFNKGAQKAAQEALEAALRNRHTALNALKAAEEEVAKRLPALREAEDALVKAGVRYEPNSLQVERSAEALEKLQNDFEPYQRFLDAARENWQKANEAVKNLSP